MKHLQMKNVEHDAYVTGVYPSHILDSFVITLQEVVVANLQANSDKLSINKYLIDKQRSKMIVIFVFYYK